jgi:hypothetical protein
MDARASGLISKLNIGLAFYYKVRPIPPEASIKIIKKCFGLLKQGGDYG